MDIKHVTKFLNILKKKEVKEEKSEETKEVKEDVQASNKARIEALKNKLKK